jgi:diguanylate cyclase (GGDEF)-like protein
VSLLNRLSLNTLILSTILVFFIAISTLFYQDKIRNFQRETKELKLKHELEVKKTLQKEISSAVDYINYKRETTQDRLRSDIKKAVYLGYDISNGLYHNMKDKYSKDEIINNIKASLRDVRFFDNRAYFYIYDTNYKNILHPIYREVENTYIHKTLLDSKGNNILDISRDTIKKNNEGFIEYEFFHLDDKSKFYKKVGYVKKLPFYDMYIGVAEYEKDYEDRIKKEIFERLSKVRFGKDGYLFIDDYDGTILMHPMKPHIVGKNLMSYKDINGVYVIKNLIDAAKKKDGDFVYYNWHRPDSDSNEINKVSFAMGIQDWNWMIGGGLYIDDIEESLKHKQDLFKDQLEKEMILLGLIMSILVITLFLIIKWFNIKSEKSLKNILNFFVEAGTKNIYLDEKKIYFKEFRSLVKVINSMIRDRIDNETKLQQLNEELTNLTNKDPLTGAYNRRYFYNIVKDLLEISKRDKSPLSLVMIDIDNFKSINDTYGHDVGDDVIKTLVDISTKVIRKSDTLFRFGGEEFVILFRNTDAKQALGVMQKIQKNIEQTQKDAISFTFSGGISEFFKDADDVESVIKKSDEKLYKAKKNGKNQVIL